jgi:erythromycin esterase-like protein
MGFDVLVWESGLYAAAKAWERITAGEDAFTRMQRAVFGIWTRVEEVQPLIEHIDQQAPTSRPLEIAGADPQLKHAEGDADRRGAMRLSHLGKSG